MLKERVMTRPLGVEEPSIETPKRTEVELLTERVRYLEETMRDLLYALTHERFNAADTTRYLAKLAGINIVQHSGNDCHDDSHKDL